MTKEELEETVDQYFMSDASDEDKEWLLLRLTSSLNAAGLILLARKIDAPFDWNNDEPIQH